MADAICALATELETFHLGFSNEEKRTLCRVTALSFENYRV